MFCKNSFHDIEDIEGYSKMYADLLFYYIAITGRDFQQLDKTVQLIQGREERLCFDIITINDTAVEGTEAFSVFLDGPVGVNISKGEETITINDDGDSKWMVLIVLDRE